MFANILQPLIDLNEAILKFFHDNLGFTWGLAIVGLTVLVRSAILPLTFKQVRSMQALQQLQPEIKKLQSRYKDDKQRMQQEMMRFYQENSVNPLASCFPLLLQLPFFLGLFYTLQSNSFENDVRESGQAAFLFIDDITKNATGSTLVILIIIYIITQLGSSHVSAMVATDKNQKRLLYALPFVFVPFIINFPAGLMIYWITTNTWTIGQQLVVRKLMPPPHLKTDDEDGDDDAKAKKKKSKAAPAGAAAAVATAGGGGGGGGTTKAERRGRGAARTSSGGPKKASDESGGSGSGAGRGSTKAKGKSSASSDGGNGNSGTQKGPPPSPRKKKKRTGRRR